MYLYLNQGDRVSPVSPNMLSSGSQSQISMHISSIIKVNSICAIIKITTYKERDQAVTEPM